MIINIKQNKLRNVRIVSMWRGNSCLLELCFTNEITHENPRPEKCPRV